jgi:hypothetical protein
MKLHPKDIVALVTFCVDIPLLLLGQTFPATLVVMGGLALFVGAEWYETRFYRVGGKISWLDFIQIRDLMTHGNNYEAIKFTMKQAFDMDEKEILTLKPEEFAKLMSKLRVEQRKDET